MNYNKDVVVFTLLSTSILLLYSLFAEIYPGFFTGLEKVSIISDIVSVKKSALTIQPVPETSDSMATTPVPGATDSQATAQRQVKRVNLKYTTPRVITSFDADTSKPSMPAFMRKLQALKRTKKGKIRIAWFGDSMIEGDMLSQTFRKKMQQFFGGSFGVGFIAANSVTANFRATASHKWTGQWTDENFKTKNPESPLYLSGHTYFTGNGDVIIKDKTLTDSNQVLEKSLLCGHLDGPLTLTVNGAERQTKADKLFNRIVLETGTDRSIDVEIKNSKLPVYGISFEPVDGVVVDNFSFRGISGIELGKLDSLFLRTLDEENPYDLVILEYGTNVLWQPDNTDFSWYRRCISPVFSKLKREMPGSEFLVISASDRAFQYDQTWKSAIGIENLVRVQAELASMNDDAFYNMYESMGGSGTIVKWADTTPALANKDYIHPNFRGADILGNMLFDAFMKEYDKAGRSFYAGEKTAAR